jgi:three-Cys-motif partner protein
MLVSFFNDSDTANINSLKTSINSIPNIAKLKHPPRIVNFEIEGTTIASIFERQKIVPTLFFIDPFGYKGLSLQLINSVLKDWGCDCIFFFNFNRINMGISNLAVEEHMNALFGEVRVEQLRKQFKTLSPSPDERELTVVEAICDTLKEKGGKYVLPFRFRHEIQNRTSHHLIFVSKNVKGYGIMKDIMAKESTDQPEGVPSFEYNPATTAQTLLFSLNSPLDALGSMLLDKFAGKTITMKEIYDQYHVDKPYIEKNYKAVLNSLERQGKIQAEPPASKRRKSKGETTFGDGVKVTFPSKQ